MTDEERAHRGVILPHVNKVRTTTEMRLDFLEADASAQRTAILRLEREVRWHRVALWILSGFVYLWTLWRLFL